MQTWTSQIAFALAIGLAPATGTIGRTQENLSPESTALAEYIARPDPDFGWTERSAGRIGKTNYVELTLISQEWHGITWKHQLYIVRPSTLNPAASHGLLVIAGNAWKDEYDDPATQIRMSKSAPVYAELAEQLGTPVAVLLQVPFQPLFDNLTEDWLIAYTFEKYLQSGRTDWPLLLPMVKSAVRAMDAVQGYTKKKWGLNVQTFTVTGASKRGWTTWLTGAVDRRATAIVPMVIDVLNMAPHMRLARATWGGPSEKVEPYTKRGLLDRLDTAEGRRLLRIVDPYSYRHALTQPKLIINGTNDDYWVTDATNLYWNDLPGEKHLLYVPNNNHSLKDYGRVIGSTLALHQHQAGGTKLPAFTWEFGTSADAITLKAMAEPRPQAFRVWMTENPTSDLRKAKWISHSLTANKGEAHFQLAPSKNFQAFFIEAEFREGRPLPLYLSTTMRVLPPAGTGTVPVAASQ
jgi:PhoPQ-activated pathogenicity-related protein